jgi:hypothetical protein
VSGQRYYEVIDDVARPNRWFVGEPVLNFDPATVRGTEFLRGNPVDLEGTLRAGITIQGEPLDFTFAEFGVPVVRRAIAERIAAIAPAAVQRIPLIIPERPAESFEVLNVIVVVDCLDQERSKVTRWSEADGVPELVGQYLSVLDPVVDPSRIGGEAVFRIAGWLPPIIVNERVAQVLAGATGIKIQPIGVVEVN